MKYFRGSFTSSREIRTGAAGSGVDGSTADDAEAVSIIELRRLRSDDDAGGQGRSGRKINKRFLVSGHWRQVACGEGRKLRKPRWIDGYLKGSPDAPLMALEDCGAGDFAAVASTGGGAVLVDILNVVGPRR